jgi:hypothetical protein
VDFILEDESGNNDMYLSQDQAVNVVQIAGHKIRELRELVENLSRKV